MLLYVYSENEQELIIRLKSNTVILGRQEFHFDSIRQRYTVVPLSCSSVILELKCFTLSLITQIHRSLLLKY